MPIRFPAPLRRLAPAALLALLPLTMLAHTLPVTPLPLYIGNYADAIHAADFDPATGILSGGRPLAPVPKASFLAKSQNGRFLYAVSETGAGTVHAFAIDPDRAGLTALNSLPSGGPGPCDVALSPDGRLVAVANYSGGSVSVFRVQDDGYLGERIFFSQHSHATDVFPGRQKKPHAHGVTWSPEGRLLLVPDLGGDRVYLYARDLATDTLAANPAQAWLETPAGAGPRHAQFSPDGHHLYVINELGNTVTVAAHDAAAGTLTPIETVSTLPPEGFAGATKTAEIAVHPTGHTVYASNRGADTLAVFGRDAATGRLTPRGHVPVPPNPRHFALSPDARWLLSASQDASVIAVFAVDPATGALTASGAPFETPKPVCLRF
jgi:6-phosphogluconolactonase